MKFTNAIAGMQTRISQHRTSARKQTLSLGLMLLLAATLVVGCGTKSASSSPDCPFSELSWSSSVSDMISVEGEDYETYDSVYGGTTYTYERAYKDATGTVKYMFDDKEKLASIAWAYGSDNEGELYTLYHSIHADLVETYGESGYQTEKETNYGDVWYRKEGNILISTMVTESQKALQFAYLSPEHSTALEDKHQSTKPDLIQ